MRTMIYAGKHDGEIVIERQRLTKNPPGNASDRKKAMRSGWQPTWVRAECRSIPVEDFEFPQSTGEGAEIYNENEHVAEMGRDLAAQTIQEIEQWNANFEPSEFVPVPVFIGHQLLCWVCDEKYACATHEGHPICNDCLDHFLKGESN